MELEHLADFRRVGISVELGEAKVDRAIEGLDIARLEERIGKHLAQSRRKRDRELEGNGLGFERGAGPEQRQIRMRYGVEKARFLDATRGFRVSDIRKRCVQYEN